MRSPRRGMSRRAVEGHRGRSSTDDTLAVLTVALVALAAVPNASVAPPFWLAWSALAGVLLAAQAAFTRRPALTGGGNTPVLVTVVALGICVPLFGLWQSMSVQFTDPAAFAGHTIPPGSLAPAASATGAVRQLGLAALFLVVIRLAADPGRATLMALALFGVIALNAAFSIVALRLLGDVALVGEKTAYLGSATGTFVNRNAFATHLGFGLVLGTGLVLARLHPDPQSRRRQRPVLDDFNLTTLTLAIALLVVATALIATQSRMGILSGLIGASAVVAWMGPIADRPARIRLRWSIAVLLGGGALILALGGPDLFERGLLVSEDVSTRRALYRQVLAMIADRPWQGVGLDAFPVAFELSHADPVDSGVTWDHAHSSYLALWAEMGVVIGSLPMLALALAGVHLLRRSRARQRAGVPAGAFGALLLAAVHASIDFSFEIPANAMLFVSIIALGLGAVAGRK